MRRSLAALRRDKNAGVAMILVLCAAAIFLSMALALVYSASVLLAAANQKQMQEQCYQLARTFSDVVTRELCLPEPAVGGEGLAAAGSLFRYANKFLDETYADYDPDDPDQTVYQYETTDTGDPADPYGRISVSFYKELPTAEEAEEDALIPVENIQTGDLLRYLIGKEQERFNDYSFSVRVTAARDKERYTFTKRYYRSVTYGTEYRLNGQQLWHDETGWYTDPECKTPYTAEIQISGLTAKYLTTDVRSRQFLEESTLFEDGGADGPPPTEGGTP